MKYDNMSIRKYDLGANVAYPCAGCEQYFSKLNAVKITILTAFDICDDCLGKLEQSIVEFRKKNKR